MLKVDPPLGPIVATHVVTSYPSPDFHDFNKPESTIPGYCCTHVTSFLVK